MNDATVPDDEVTLDPVNEIEEAAASTEAESTQTQENETKPDTTEEPSPSVESDEDKAQKAVQARFNKLTAKRYKAEREAEDLKRRLAIAEGAITAQTAEAPKLEDFDFDEAKFNEANIKHQVAEQLKIVRQSDSEQATLNASTQARNDLADKFTVREEEFAAKTKGYAEAVSTLPQFQPDTLDVIYSMDNGPEMAFYLGNHLDVADEIATASLGTAAVRLGQIAAGLTSAPTAEISTTKAPDPVETIGGNSGSALTEKDDPLLAGAKFE